MTDIKTNVTTLEENKVQLEVEVPESEVKAQVEHTIKSLAKSVNLPGFRKGKIPRQVLVSRLGKEAILAQTLSEAMTGWYESAVEDAGIKPIDQPDIDELAALEEDQPFGFKAVVQVRPRPQLGKYTGLEVEKEATEITDEEVEEPITRLRKRMADLETVTGRPAGEGDFVVIDFTGYLGEEPLEGGSGKDFMLELGSKSFIPGFEDQVAGMEQGQSKKLTLTFPENYQPEKLAGQEVTFDVTVNEIKERVLPEANDEFAAEASEFETIAELRDDIRSRLAKAREEASERFFREKALQLATDQAQVDIPEVMIADRTEEMKSEFATALRNNGIPLEAYLAQMNMSLEELEASMKHEAEHAVKQDLVLDAIAEVEKIEVSDEEVEEEIRNRAEAMSIDPDEFLKKTKSARRMGTAREKLLRRKALESVAASAIPVPVKADADDAAPVIEP